MLECVKASLVFLDQVQVVFAMYTMSSCHNNQQSGSRDPRMRWNSVQMT